MASRAVKVAKYANLFVGQVTKITTLAEATPAALRIANVRSPYEQFDEYLTMYFTHYTEQWAAIKPGVDIALGDTVLIGSAEKPRAHDVNYDILKVMQRWGTFVDPVSRREVSALGIDEVEVRVEEVRNKHSLHALQFTEELESRRRFIDVRVTGNVEDAFDEQAKVSSENTKDQTER